jgi:hypothetical protein
MGARRKEVEPSMGLRMLFAEDTGNEVVTRRAPPFHSDDLADGVSGGEELPRRRVRNEHCVRILQQLPGRLISDNGYVEELDDAHVAHTEHARQEPVSGADPLPPVDDPYRLLDLAGDISSVADVDGSISTGLSGWLTDRLDAVG